MEHKTLAMAHIFLHNRQAGLDELENTISLNPNAIMGIRRLPDDCSGEYNRGIELIRNSAFCNKSPPRFV